jgi:hypothetical protein
MRPTNLHRRSVPLFTVPALAAAAAILAPAFGAGASAQDPGARTLTLKEPEKGSDFTHIRNTKTRSPRADSQGDVFAFTNPLADESGHIVGKLSAACTTTTGARNFLKSTVSCFGVVALHDGSLMIQFNLIPGSPRTVGAVTGGTGGYANARGVLVSRVARSGSVDTITLAN